MNIVISRFYVYCICFIIFKILDTYEATEFDVDFKYIFTGHVYITNWLRLKRIQISNCFIQIAWLKSDTPDRVLSVRVHVMEVRVFVL